MGNQRENRSCKPYPDLRRLTRSRSLARVTRSERVTLWWSTRLVSSRRRARSSGALRILASRHLNTRPESGGSLQDGTRAAWACSSAKRENLSFPLTRATELAGSQLGAFHRMAH